MHHLLVQCNSNTTSEKMRFFSWPFIFERNAQHTQIGMRWLFEKHPTIVTKESKWRTISTTSQFWQRKFRTKKKCILARLHCCTYNIRRIQSNKQQRGEQRNRKTVLCKYACNLLFFLCFFPALNSHSERIVRRQL